MPNKDEWWNSTELDRLKAHHQEGITTLRRHLPRRSVLAIRQKASKIGLVIGFVERGDRAGMAWRGKLPIPERAHPIVRRMFEEMNRQQCTIKELALKAGVDDETISLWRYRSTPRLDMIIACLNALDLDLAVNPQEG